MNLPAVLSRRRPSRRLVLTGAAAASTAALPFVLDPPYALAVAGLVLIAFIGLSWRAAARIKRLRRDIAAKHAATDLLRTRAEQSFSESGDDRRARRILQSLAGGFPYSAVKEARSFASQTKIPFADRLALLRSVEAWQLETEQAQLAAPKRSVFDVVFISHCGLPGGNTSANTAEIGICRDLGLKVGLLHHPVYQWDPNAPLNPRIEELIDGESVRLIGFDDEVECALAVVRPPISLMHPLERRPRITAGRTVVIANQTPFKFYGAEGPRDAAWDIATVERNVTDWLGAHTWYAGGPLVRATLHEHHAEEIADLDLAPEPWNEVIELDRWRLDERRVPDGRIRIGRHSRDHKLKWPEHRETLLACYPDREPFEIHVLGGAEIPARLLDGLPENWTVHPFNSLTARDFLAGIDVMAYFIASDGMEAFGRAPLEAMAAGVPVIMDRRFAPTFGPAAVYCEPDEVAAVAERLTADPDAYAAQQEAAWSHLADRFSGKSLMDRLPLPAVASGPA
ncbi:glycosyltransferase [Glycomyces rhizosphaerae]|uniref:Glycosyltransferase n=1 Tax=Glycomyces rhizosphaerae TaxID=2054422 RepID=A0ABV7PU81_9ACTN